MPFGHAFWLCLLAMPFGYALWLWLLAMAIGFEVQWTPNSKRKSLSPLACVFKLLELPDDSRMDTGIDPTETQQKSEWC
jgi:hypothetical protein